MPIDEGVIKFDASQFVETAALDDASISEINPIRCTLYEKKLIGEYQDLNIGYGNISQRMRQPSQFSGVLSNVKPNPLQAQFIISGTQTGHLDTLTGRHYTCVASVDLLGNTLQCQGPIMASSESLTHGAIYLCNDTINAVIHIHNKTIWQGMLKDKLKHTPSHIPYGTFEMAQAVQLVVAKQSHGSLAMAGHEDGVMFYGESLQTAFSLCMDMFERYTAS